MILFIKRLVFPLIQLYYILRDHCLAFKENIKKRQDYNYLIKCGVETKIGYVNLIGKPIIRKHLNSRIILDKNITLISDTTHNIAGINHPVIIATCAENALIHIGENTGVSGASIVAVKQIKIGKNVGLGANANIYDTDFHPIDPNSRKLQKDITEALALPVEISDGVWLGANVTILKGVTIGIESVIGCNSVVTKSIDSRELYAGNPAKFLRKI